MKLITKLLLISFLLASTKSQLVGVVDKNPKLPVHDKLEYFLKLADSIRIQSNVPGVGIAIVYNNDVIYTGGLGYRDIEKKLPVTENTLFSIGSNTKGFTGVLATKLVERGLLDWNTPLSEYIPELEFKEPYITANASLSDALGHKVGLARSTDQWKYKKLSRSALMAKIKDLDFTSSFRSSFDYNNIMYMVAGVATERVTNKSWEELVVEELLDPLGMTNSFARHQEFMEHHERAVGYTADGITIAPPVDITSVAPSGAISSTPKDISKWIELIVNNGMHDGKPFLSKAEYDYMFRPHSGVSIRNTDEIWYYYMGLGGYSKNGKRTLGANGAIDGQNSRSEFLLDEGFGIFVMTNKISGYKELLSSYAKNIFVNDDYSRNHEEENRLAQEAGFHRFMSIILNEGPAKATTFFETLSIKPGEDYMNQLGYGLMAQDDLDEAIVVLKLNVETYPDSANAHDSMGEAYYNKKQFELSLQHYQKSVALDDSNVKAKEMIEQLKSKK